MTEQQASAQTSPHPHLRVDRDGPVLTVSLSNPQRRNAKTPSLWLALAEVAESVDPEVRVVVLRADGPSFSAGLDLAMLTPTQQTAFIGHRATVADVVAAGPAAFDQDAMIDLLVATSGVVNDILDTGTCDGYLDAP